MPSLNEIFEDAYKFLRLVEGLKLKPYTCTAGKRTIGIGHVILPDEQHFEKGITETIAKDLFKSDISWAYNAVRDNVKVKLNKNQTVALVSFVFNLGATAFYNSTLLKVINKGDFKDVGNQFLRWNKERKNKILVESKGLTNRRKSEIELFYR